MYDNATCPFCGMVIPWNDVEVCGHCQRDVYSCHSDIYYFRKLNINYYYKTSAKAIKAREEVLRKAELDKQREYEKSQSEYKNWLDNRWKVTIIYYFYLLFAAFLLLYCF